MIGGKTRVLGPRRFLVAIAAMRGGLFPFVPVALALGIGGYFVLPAEPGVAAWAGLGMGAVVLSAVWARGPEDMQLPAALLALVCVGALMAGVRAHLVAAPVLEWRFHGAVSGRIVEVDRSLSDRVRLTLDRVTLEGLPPARTPERVRVSLHGTQGFVEPVPGTRVTMTAHMMPPAAPAEPGGFDFRRLAWFERLGAVGYTRTPVLALKPAPEALDDLAITRWRMRLAQAVRARVPGQPGAFAAAILAGDRAGVSRGTLADLRGANLAHLLAISGLHMGLLTGFVLGALRLALALVPPVALRVDTRKIAAGGALAAAAAYLALSGGNIATQRAFVMVGVMLVAVLTDRRAISLRSVAIAAVILLTLRPEALTRPGFQMSFAATTALVATFAALRRRPAWRDRLPRWGRPVAGVILCSLVAGLATAPVSAAHFNRIAEYGLLANVMTVPLMGTLMMPSAALAAVLAPLGLAGAPLGVMELAARWILGVAAWVAALDGAVLPVPKPPGWVLPVLALGAIWMALWAGRARWVGAALVLAAAAGWAGTQRPAVLMSERGTLVGVKTPAGRALSKPGGEGFVARSWLENDGDLALQAAAHERAGFDGPDGARRFDAAGLAGLHLTGRGARDRVKAACNAADLVVLGNELERRDTAAPRDTAMPGASAPLVELAVVRRSGRGRCLIIDRVVLRRTGTLALYPGGAEGPSWRGARQQAGRRLWTTAP